MASVPIAAHAQSTQPSAIAEGLVSGWASAPYTYQPGVLLAASRPPADSVAEMPYAVAAGDWSFVTHQLEVLTPQDALRVYHHILQSLSQSKSDSSILPMLPKDVFALAETLPAGVDLPDADVPLLGQVLANSLKSQGLPADLLASLEAGTPHFGGTNPAKRLRLGQLLFLAGKSSIATRYLPSPDDALKNPQSQLTLLVYRNTLAAASEADAAGDSVGATRLRKAALALAIAHLKAVPTSNGPDPLVNDVFALCDESGDIRSLVDWIGGMQQSDSPHLDQALLLLARMPQPATGNLTARVNVLTLQREVALLLLNGDKGKLTAGSPRQIALEIFAANWTAEAVFTRSSFFPPRPTQRIPQTYGSIAAPPGEPDVISSQQLLLLRPTDPWLGALRAESQLALQKALIPLAMNADEVDLAMKAFSSVAVALPDSLDGIGGDALLIWAHKHETRRIIGTNVDHQPVAAGIPLTRRGQDRNIQQLASILKSLQKTYGRPLSPSQLPRLFTMIYSQAEVFRLSDIEQVFGPLDRLDTDTTIALATLMRTNLETTWQDPNIQNAFGTGLDADEIAANIKKGYDTLITLLQRQADASHDYRVDVALAISHFSQSRYLQSQNAGLSAFVAAQQASFEGIHRAANEYAAGTTSIKQGNESADLYSLWFAMALGSLDITKSGIGDTINSDEVTHLVAALHALPGDAARRHSELFTLDLNEHLKSIPRETKNDVLRAALPIIGDTPLAWPVTSLINSYNDLLSEIHFNIRIDGSTNIGAGQPFGFVVALEHTDRLEHEVGTFSKYAVNQLSGRTVNSNGNIAPVNYQERLERHIRLALYKGFDVLGIVWAPEDVHSYPTENSGWRRTPLAYVIAKAKDASVDRIAPIPIDLDFNDNLSQVVLPIEAGGVQLNATAFTPRPTARLSIDQTINDRDMSTGKAVLTIKADGAGVMPDLDRLIDTHAIDGFTVADIRDGGLQTDRFEVKPVSDGDYAAKPEPTILSQRVWTITLQASPSANARVAFRFPVLKAPFNAPGVVTASYFRLSDADIQPVDSTLAIQGFAYATTRSVWPWVGALLSLLAVIGVTIAFVVRRRSLTPLHPETQPIRSELTLFSTLALLQSLKTDSSLSLDSRDGTSLADDIRTLEHHHFNRPGATHDSANSVDLDALVRKWSIH